MGPLSCAACCTTLAAPIKSASALGNRFSILTFHQLTEDAAVSVTNNTLDHPRFGNTVYDCWASRAFVALPLRAERTLYLTPATRCRRTKFVTKSCPPVGPLMTKPFHTKNFLFWNKVSPEQSSQASIASKSMAHNRPEPPSRRNCPRTIVRTRCRSEISRGRSSGPNVATTMTPDDRPEALSFQNWDRTTVRRRCRFKKDLGLTKTVIRVFSTALFPCPGFGRGGTDKRIRRGALSFPKNKTLLATFILQTASRQHFFGPTVLCRFPGECFFVANSRR